MPLPPSVLNVHWSTSILHHNIHFAALLKDAKLIMFATEQGKRLGIADWEIDSLIELCKRRKCLSTGMGVLSEYAALQDQRDAKIRHWWGPALITVIIVREAEGKT